MAYLVLILLGGFFNFIKFRNKTAHFSDESMPHRTQGYVAAFIGGAFVYGSAMCFVYWLVG